MRARKDTFSSGLDTCQSASRAARLTALFRGQGYLGRPEKTHCVVSPSHVNIYVIRMSSASLVRPEATEARVLQVASTGESFEPQARGPNY